MKTRMRLLLTFTLCLILTVLPLGTTAFAADGESTDDATGTDIQTSETQTGIQDDGATDGDVNDGADNNAEGNPQQTTGENAVVRLVYVDEKGNDIGALLKDSYTSIAGSTGGEMEIPTPTHDWYEWKYYILSTTQGEAPSGYLDNQYDTTVTFGEGDASHIKVVYQAHAALPIRYVDTAGNDLAALGVVPSTSVQRLQGIRGEEFEFDVPALPRYTLKSVELHEPDTEGFVPSVLNFNKAVLYTGNFNVGCNSEVVVTYSAMSSKLTLVNPEGTGLQGGQIEVYNAAGTKVWSGVSNALGEYELPALGAGEYSITETVAPAGYYRSTLPWSIKVSNANEVTGTLRYINSPIIKTVQNLNASTGSPISGAVFGIYDSNNVLLNQGTTDANGKVSFRIQQSGKYTIKQISVPGEYAPANETATFTVTENTTDDGNNTYTIRNTKPVQTGVELPLYTVGILCTAALLACAAGIRYRRRSRV